MADRETLLLKYRQERDKRIRPDGNDQYVEPTGPFADLLHDPFTTVVQRPTVHDEVTVCVIGAGFGGLATAAQLKMAGIDDVRLIDGGGDVGGAWYWNRYPGAMCDTAAMVYLPLLEETGTVPSAKYVLAPEILEHARSIARRFDLYDDALFSTGVTALTWDEPSARWIVRTDRGDDFRARFVAMGTGPLHRPKLPGIEGIDTFAGRRFHTSRWDYHYTGGDPQGATMTNLGDKRIGIIGTGATGVQCIPRLARDAAELFVFQRTPSSIDVRNNQPIDPEWFATLAPGWQHEWLLNFATLQTGGFTDEDLVKDGWTDIAKRVRDRVVANAPTELTLEVMQQAYWDSDDEKMEEIRARVDAVVNDSQTAEHLKPWYRQLCKRPCFHDEYLDSYNRANVHLVDTNGRGVERIDETGVWVEGQHYELDCIIFASGFEVGTEQARRSGFETTGREGTTLSEHWADGMRSLHGVTMRNFPNLFIIGFAQAANLVSNVTHNLVDAGQTIATIVAHTLASGSSEVEPTERAEREWVELILSSTRGFAGDPDCTPGYYNNEGHELSGRELLSGGYPEGPVAYFAFIDAWRHSGDFAGLEFR